MKQFPNDMCATTMPTEAEAHTMHVQNDNSRVTQFKYWQFESDANRRRHSTASISVLMAYPFSFDCIQLWNSIFDA
jgi:hypothetical protein